MYSSCSAAVRRLPAAIAFRIVLCDPLAVAGCQLLFCTFNHSEIWHCAIILTETAAMQKFDWRSSKMSDNGCALVFRIDSIDSTLSLTLSPFQQCAGLPLYGHATACRGDLRSRLELSRSVLHGVAFDTRTAQEGEFVELRFSRAAAPSAKTKTKTGKSTRAHDTHDDSISDSDLEGSEDEKDQQEEKKTKVHVCKEDGRFWVVKQANPAERGESQMHFFPSCCNKRMGSLNHRDIDVFSALFGDLFSEKHKIKIPPTKTRVRGDDGKTHVVLHQAKTSWWFVRLDAAAKTDTARACQQMQDKLTAALLHDSQCVLPVLHPTREAKAAPFDLAVQAAQALIDLKLKPEDEKVDRRTTRSDKPATLATMATALPASDESKSAAATGTDPVAAVAAAATTMATAAHDGEASNEGGDRDTMAIDD